MDMRNFFQRSYDWLAGFGRYLRKLILDAFTDTVKDFTDLMGPTIEEILLDIQADPSLVTDSARRNSAIKRIKDKAKEAGLASIQSNIINLAIEIVLQALKSSGRLGDNAGE